MALGIGDRTMVCMRCGSERIHNQTSGEGLWAAGGEGVAWVCDDCHHIGAPFLVRDSALSARDERLWKAEWEAASLALDDEAWQPPGRTETGRIFGWALVVLGAVFLVPVALALLRAASAGNLFVILWTFVGSGWLVAIGLALTAVGTRSLRRPATEATAPDEPREGPAWTPAEEAPTGKGDAPVQPARRRSD